MNLSKVQAPDFYSCEFAKSKVVEVITRFNFPAILLCHIVYLKETLSHHFKCLCQLGDVLSGEQKLSCFNWNDFYSGIIWYNTECNCNAMQQYDNIFTYYDTLYYVCIYIYTYCYLYHHFITVDISQRYLVFSPTSPVEIYSHQPGHWSAYEKRRERRAIRGMFLLPFLPRTPTYPWSIPQASPNPQMKGIPS